MRAYRAIHGFRAAGPSAAKWLGERLRPAPVEKERKAVARLLAGLDSDNFATREAASRQLRQLGAWATPHLHARLQQSPSAETRRRLEGLLHRLQAQENQEPRGEALRVSRAMEALEQLGTPEARAALEQLAMDSPDARLVAEARAALERLARRCP